jgi:hypothetical protein
MGENQDRRAMGDPPEERAGMYAQSSRGREGDPPPSASPDDDSPTDNTSSDRAAEPPPPETDRDSTLSDSTKAANAIKRGDGDPPP